MERYARVNPWHGDFHGRFAQTLAQAGQYQRAMAEAERGIELDPTLVPLRRWLAQAYRRAGRHEDARRQEELIQRMRGR